MCLLLCWCAAKKPLTHSLTHSLAVFVAHFKTRRRPSDNSNKSQSHLALGGVAANML